MKLKMIPKKKWKDTPCSWIGRILLKWPYYPKQSTDLMQSVSNYSSIFHRTRTSNPKIYMEPQKTQNCQRHPEEKEQAGGITFADFRQY